MTTDQKALPPEYECRKAFFDWLSTKNTNDLIGYEAMFSVWQAAWNTRSQPLAGLVEEINDSNLKAFLDSIDFSNSCCGCDNHSYSVGKPFRFIRTHQPRAERGADYRAINKGMNTHD